MKLKRNLWLMARLLILVSTACSPVHTDITSQPSSQRKPQPLLRLSSNAVSPRPRQRLRAAFAFQPVSVISGQLQG
jgi:hypothetical protein